MFTEIAPLVEHILFLREMASPPTILIFGNLDSVDMKFLSANFTHFAKLTYMCSDIISVSICSMTVNCRLPLFVEAMNYMRWNHLNHTGNLSLSPNELTHNDIWINDRHIFFTKYAIFVIVLNNAIETMQVFKKNRKINGHNNFVGQDIINKLWPSNAMWQHDSGTTLAQWWLLG